MVTTQAKKPDIQSPKYMETFKGIQEAMEAVDGVRVANRGSPFANHVAAVADGILMLLWVTVDPKPHDYVKEMIDSAQYNGNRVVKEYKEKSDGLQLKPKLRSTKFDSQRSEARRMDTIILRNRPLPHRIYQTIPPQRCNMEQQRRC